MHLRKLLYLPLGFAALVLHAWGADADIDLYYTQYAYNNIAAAVGKVHVQYSLSSNTLTLSGNATLISSAVDSTFGGADGLIINNNNGNLLVAGGGTAITPGLIYQLTPNGSKATPYSVNPNTPSAYTLTIVPANGSRSGFPAGSLITTEKDFGYGRIAIMPLSPNLINGIAYLVTGDDVYVTSVAFGSDGTAYYGSGTEESNAGNFGTVVFDGTKFITHRLFGQPVGSDPRGGIIFTGTHRLCFDIFTGDIFAAGGNTVGQYDPSANVFHILPIYGVASNFEFSQPITDGQGHLLVTACCGLPGDSQNGEGDLILVDYSSAPGHQIDAPAGVRYSHTFLAANLGTAAIDTGGQPPPGPPQITQQPRNATAIVGQTATFAVTATGAGLSYQWQSKPTGAAGFTSIPGATSSSYTTPPVALTDNGTQFVCVASNSQGAVPSTPAVLTVLQASTNFITSTSLGLLRNNYTGWVGMSISVGSSPLAITALGRVFAAGNNGSHTVKIVDATTGSDVNGASVVVSMPGAAPGTFVYANLPASVTLSANSTYYVLSQESAGGDQWYDWNTTAQGTSVASLTSAAYGMPYTNVTASAGHSYGPVDFKYAASISVTVAPSMTTLSNAESQQFTATVSETSNASVIWSIRPLVGSITLNGLYAAPSVITNSQPITITATSGADTTKFATATVNLIAAAPPIITQQPQSVIVASGQTATFSVSASGGNLSYRWESKSSTAPSFTAIPGAVSITLTTGVVSTSDNGTQFHCIVSNSQGAVTSNAALITISSGATLVSSFVLGTPRNNYSGWVGMAIKVGSAPISVMALGRFVSSSNTSSHTVKIVDAASGNDVAGGSAIVNTLGVASGAFTYATLNSPIVLNSNASYYILSQETAGGDQWYDLNTTLLNNPVASIMAAAYNSQSSYITVGNTAGHSYGPVDFSYLPTQANATFISSFNVGTARNNFTGWVGGNIAIGALPIKVTHLGRFVLAGNTGTHIIKIVMASTAADVAGGSVSVNLSGGLAGSFVYAALASPVTLSPNITYYIVSQEVGGGDQWFDHNATVQTSSAAVLNGGEYSSDGVTYFAAPGTNQMYVPVDFKYALQ